MTEYLDMLLPAVRKWGEDLREEEFYVGQAWLEIRDDETFNAAVLHFFNDGGEYLKSVNGNFSVGSWRYLEDSNKMLLSERGAGGELYDLAFMDGQFFILTKHGDPHKKNRNKYFVMVAENRGKGLEWRDVIDLIYDKYRNTSSYYFTIALIILVIIAIIMVLSLG